MSRSSGDDTRDELVTASGIRIVGPARDLFREAATLRAPESAEEWLYAASFGLHPRLGTSTIPPLLAALGEAMTRLHPKYLPLERDRDDAAEPDRSHARQWRVIAGRDRWTGELIWRHPHPVLRGQALVTHLVANEFPGTARLEVRVGIPGGIPAGFSPVAAGQAHPPFLGGLHRVVRLGFGGGDGEPRMLRDGDIAGFVESVLLAEHRTLPVVVLTPTENGSYLVPPNLLAEEFLGIAPVYVLERHPTTFRLTDALGDKRLSCFWGAMRAYLPEFSCADDPYRHPLVFGDRVSDPVVRAQFRGALALAAVRGAQPLEGVDALRRRAAPGPLEPEPPAAPAAPGPAAGQAPPAAAAPAAGTSARVARAIASLEERLDELLGAVNRLTTVTTRLLDEVAGIRTTDTLRGATAAGLERRIGDLERWLRARLDRDEFGEAVPADPHEPLELPEEDSGAPNLVDVVRQAAMDHADVLLFHDKALASAGDSPYQDVNRVAAVLDAMALVARRRQTGSLGTPLREAFRELGVDYRRGVSASTSERMLQQYTVALAGGEEVLALEHIALGSSRDPRHCLRIYFTSQAPAEPRFVIAHVGRHFEVKTTN